MGTIKLAYKLNGESVPYNSKDAEFRLRFKKHTPKSHIENVQVGIIKALPSIDYMFYGGPGSVSYLPEKLDEQMKRDLAAIGLDKIDRLLLAIDLPPNKKLAELWAGMSEDLYRGLPPPTTSLGDRMSF